MLRRRLIAALALGAIVCSASAESAIAAARRTASVSSTTVSAIQPADAADIILLSSGSAAGFRQGMVCLVSRGTSPIAELVLVDLRAHSAAGLITALAAREQIRPGDTVAVKLQTN